MIQARYSARLVAGLSTLLLIALATASMSSASASAAAARKSHGTINVGIIAPVNSQIASVPELYSADEAAARAINAAGGIDGDRVNILTCDGQNDPNHELACAQQLVSDHIVAMVGSNWIANDAGVNQVLTRAKVANIASSTPQPIDYSSPISFEIDSFFAGTSACVAKTFTHVIGSRAVVPVAVSLPVALGTLTELVKPAAQTQGASLKPTISFPPTTTSFAPIVQEVANSGTRSVLLDVAPPEVPGFVGAAIQSGQQFSYCAQEGLVNRGALASLGDLKSFYLTQALPPLTAASQYPIINTFLAEMRAEAKAGDQHAGLAPNDVVDFELRAWLGMQVFKQVAAKIHGSITATSFLTTIRKSTVTLGNFATIDFAHPVAVGPFKRVFNGKMLLSKWNPVKKDFFLVPGASVSALTLLHG
jgi:ABC-type branched-subunit amino acid transport system substrate-binding protein